TDSISRLGWHAAPTGIVADVIEPPANPTPKSAWNAFHILASSADDRGAPLRVTTNGTPTPEDAPLEPPLAYPNAPPFAVVSDSLKNVAGTALESVATRL